MIALVVELKGKLPSLVVDPEDMMQAALEEWDWCEAEKKSRQKATSSTALGTVLAAVSSEKPGQNLAAERNAVESWASAGTAGRRGIKRMIAPIQRKTNLAIRIRISQAETQEKGKVHRTLAQTKIPPLHLIKSRMQMPL